MTPDSSRESASPEVVWVPCTPPAARGPVFSPARGRVWDVSVASDVRGHWRRQRSSRPSVPSAKCFAMWKYEIVPRVTFPVDFRQVVLGFVWIYRKAKMCTVIQVVELVGGSMECSCRRVVRVGARCPSTLCRVLWTFVHLFIKCIWCNFRSVKFSQ